MLVCAAVTFLVALPVIAFPKRMVDKAVTSDTEIPFEVFPAKKAAINYESVLQDEYSPLPFFVVAQRVLTNPIWLGVTFTSIVEQSIVSAFLAYVAKYIQDLFQIPAHLASIHTGAVVVPSSLSGVLTGALLMRHYRPSIDRILAGVSFVIGFTVFATLSLMLIGCPSNRVAGLTATYDGKPWPWMYGPARLMPPNLTAACNVHSKSSSSGFYNEKRNISACSFAHFHPVCWRRSKLVEETDLPFGVKGHGPNHLTFFSPCFAGCESGVVHKNYHSDTPVEDFTQCKCLGKTFLNPSGNPLIGINGTIYDYSHVTSGRCPANCPQYSAFLAILFVHILCTGLLQNPSNVITLSCVSPEDSSVALGLQIFFLRTLAYILAPIYFGQLFDLVCQYRLAGGDRSADAINLSSDNRQTQTGGCLQCNLEGLSLVWLGMVLALKLVSLTGSTVTWKAARYRASKSQQKSTSAASSSPAGMIPTHSQSPSPSPAHLKNYPRTELKKELTEITELNATTPSDSAAVYRPEFQDPLQV